MTYVLTHPGEFQRLFAGTFGCKIEYFYPDFRENLVNFVLEDATRFKEIFPNAQEFLGFIYSCPDFAKKTIDHALTTPSELQRLRLIQDAEAFACLVDLADGVSPSYAERVIASITSDPAQLQQLKQLFEKRDYVDVLQKYCPKYKEMVMGYLHVSVSARAPGNDSSSLFRPPSDEKNKEKDKEKNDGKRHQPGM